MRPAVKESRPNRQSAQFIKDSLKEAVKNRQSTTKIHHLAQCHNLASIHLKHEIMPLRNQSWENERMKEWKNERMKEWKNERMKDWDEAIDPHRQIITYFSQSQQQWINSNQWNEWRKWCPIPQPLWSISWWNHSMISVTIWLNPSTKVGHLLLPPSAISFPPKRNSNQMRLNH